MRQYTYYILLLLCLMTSGARANDWKIYASYHNATKAVKADSRIFVVANGNLLSYDTDDQSVDTYDRATHLSDFGISDIAYSSEARTLVIVYDNSNIDLLTMDGETWNLPELKNLSATDKTLHELRTEGKEALLSTGAGLVVIDLERKYFTALYKLGVVRNAVAANGRIYANTTTGVVEGVRSTNLLDPSNWTASTTAITFGPTAEETAAQTTLLEQVKDVVPNSPVRNHAYNLSLTDGRLLVAGGNFYYPEVEYTGTAMSYEDGKWTAFDEDEALALVGADAYHNVTDVVQDPNEASHHWLGTKRSGIYEFRNLKLVNHYTYDNSPLTSILPNATHPDWYVRVTALQYDPQGNLWMMNNQCDTIVRILTSDGKWKAYYYPEVEGYPTFDNTMFDSRGWAWIQQRRTTMTHEAGLLIIDTNGTMDTQDDDRHRFLTSFYNQDGTRHTPNLYYCAVEDADGAIWVGTNEGLFVSRDPSKAFDSDFGLEQVKVARDDGTGLADYVLNEVGVKCVAIDGGNRKWIGTVDNGVYLLSADCQETVHHFTSGETPLISDEINDIAIDGRTGEVFIATSKGLCSFQGDATDPSAEMKSDNLKVFPNPVRPEYSGKVHITGLMAGSVVKIVSTAGRLVSEGTSVGGEFSWDCCYKTGRRAASGIYYALCTDSEGKEGACAKILIVK